MRQCSRDPPLPLFDIRPPVEDPLEAGQKAGDFLQAVAHGEEVEERVDHTEGGGAVPAPGSLLRVEGQPKETTLRSRILGGRWPRKAVHLRTDSVFFVEACPRFLLKSEVRALKETNPPLRTSPIAAPLSVAF